MSNRKNIDELFKENLSGFRVEPSPEAWEGIEGRFFGKRKLLGWYVASAALLLLLLGGSGYWFFTDSGSSVTTNTVNKGFAEIKPTNNENITSNPEKENTDGLSTNDDKFETENNNSNTGDINIENENDNAFDVDKKGATNNAGNAVYVNSETAKLAADTDLNNSNIASEEKNNAANMHTEFNDRPYQSLYALIPLQTDIDNDLDANMIDPEKVPGMQEYLKKQRQNHFYTGVSATAGMIYYPSTKDQFTWSADVAFGITAKKFYFETGVGYAEINEEGIYLIDLKSYDSVGYFNEVESFEIDPITPGAIIYNTKKVTVFDSINHYTHSSPLFKYSYLNIPAIVGYKFFNKNKFTATVETGLLFSVMLSKDIPQAEFENPEYTVVGVRNETPERVDWNLRWQLGIRLDYKIKKSVSFSVKPVFTKYLNSIYDTEKGYENVKPYTMGVQFGFYYGF